MIYPFTSVQDRYVYAIEDISVKKGISTFGRSTLSSGHVTVQWCIHYVEVDSPVERGSKLTTFV